MFTERVTNLEEMVVTSALCPPTGTEFYSGVADMCGFRHTNGLDADPIPFGNSYSDRPANPRYQDTWGFTFCESAPSTVYRVGANRFALNGTTYQGLAKSTNSGASWTEVKTWNRTDEVGIPWRIAAARNNANKLVIARTKAVPQYSANGGVGWMDSTGLPIGPDKRWNWSQPLAADLVKNDTFYYYSAGTVYRSTNGGQSFAVAASGLPSEGFASLKAMPGAGGEVWLSLRWNGLYRGTTDTGGAMTFAKVADVSNAESVALGKAQFGTAPATLFIYGGVRRGTTDEYGVFSVGEPRQYMGSGERPGAKRPRQYRG